MWCTRKISSTISGDSGCRTTAPRQSGRLNPTLGTLLHEGCQSQHPLLFSPGASRYSGLRRYKPSDMALFSAWRLGAGVIYHIGLFPVFHWLCMAFCLAGQAPIDIPPDNPRHFGQGGFFSTLCWQGTCKHFFKLTQLGDCHMVLL